jgi:hypothetical protein
MADLSETKVTVSSIETKLDLTSLTLDINGNQNVGLQTGNSGFYSRRPV